MKLSLRILMLAVAFAALATAAITSGGLVASLFHAVVGIGVILALITAVVGVEAPRAFAIGFVIPPLLYVILLYAVGRHEFDPHNSKFPTASLARIGYDALYRPIYSDMLTGQIVENHDPTKGGHGAGGMSTIAMTDEFPVRSEFMTTFHACVVLLGGTVGGIYAAWLHRTQKSS
jgi:hypothetical protein